MPTKKKPALTDEGERAEQSRIERDRHLLDQAMCESVQKHKAATKLPVFDVEQRKVVGMNNVFLEHGISAELAALVPDERGLVLTQKDPETRVALDVLGSLRLSVEEVERVIELNKERAKQLLTKQGSKPFAVEHVSEAEFIHLTLTQYEAALEFNPYLYFELSYTRVTSWLCWLIDKQKGGRNVLAAGQGTRMEAIKPVYNALVKLLEEQK
jgi:hypothetical protein